MGVYRYGDFKLIWGQAHDSNNGWYYPDGTTEEPEDGWESDFYLYNVIGKIAHYKLV